MITRQSAISATVAALLAGICVVSVSFAVTPTSNTMTLPIVGGVDGDTIKTRIDALPCPLCKVSIRIRGIDTPEKGTRAKCPMEAALALQASYMTKKLIGSTKSMTVINPTWDKYGGRINGDVLVGGYNVGNELLASGLARPYTGTGPKPNWCAG
jgi:micrococcal nuclease